MSDQDIVNRRRWQADAIEKHNPPKVGQWNIPHMLREDADEIERLRGFLNDISGAHMDERLDEIERDRFVLRIIERWAETLKSKAA